MKRSDDGREKSKGPAGLIGMAILAAALLAAGPAAAQDGKSDKAEKARKAKKAFDDGMEHYVQEDYTKAIVDFKRAHNLYPSAMLLYNIGMARMRMGNPRKAAEAARQALTFDGKPLPEKSRTQAQAVVAGGGIVEQAYGVAEARKAVAAAEAKEEASPRQEEASADEAASESSGSESASASASESEEERADSESAGISEPAVDSGGGLGAVGWTGVVTGTLGVAGLVGMPILASQYDSEVDRLEQLSRGPSRQAFLDQQQKVDSTRQTGQILTYGAPALTAVGAGLVVLDLVVVNKGSERVSAGVGPGGRIQVGVQW